MALVATAPHEVKAHLVYAQNGASPYWLLGKLLVEGHGGYVGNLEVAVDGETWEVMLTDTDGGLAPRAEDPVDEPLNEWQIKARGAGEHDRRKVTFEVKPRWAGLEAFESGAQVNTPFDHDEGPDEGVAVHVQGSNIEPDAYPGLLWAFVQALAADAGMDVHHSYFRTLHDWSSIYEYERYVRVRREMATKYVSNDGVLRKLLMLCADEKGSEVELKIDNQDVVGYNHRLVLPQQDAARLAPDHTLGKQLKHYHPKHTRDSGDGDADDPLYHPKIGALFRQSLNDGAVAWRDRHEIRDELEETILNTLRWSDIPVDPGGTTFVADDHFAPVATEADVTLYDDPTPQLEAEQEALVVTALRSMTDADADIVERLVEDGEGQDYATLADGAGRSVSTLYRALERMGGILESDDGEIRFGSRKLAERVTAIVESAEHHLRTATSRAAQLVAMDERRAESSAFQAWLNEYAVEVLQRKDEGRVRVRIDTVLSDLKADHYPTIAEALREGYSAWVQDGHDAAAFREVLVEWSNRGDPQTSKAGTLLAA